MSGIVNGNHPIVATLTIRPSAKERPVFHQNCTVRVDGNALRFKFLGNGYVGVLTFRDAHPDLNVGSPGSNPTLTPDA